MAARNKIVKLNEAARKRSDQRAEMKRELAAHAVTTLAQLGYARTSLRDIAAQSDRSLGALSYYFADKVDLISYCVRLYKENFVKRIDEIMTAATSAEMVLEGFVGGLVEAIDKDSETHRLWYDIRSQSLFEDGFHEVVSEIEQALINVIGRLSAHLDISTIGVKELYYLLDGSFRFHLQKKLWHHERCLEDFRNELYKLFASLGVTERR